MAPHQQTRLNLLHFNYFPALLLLAAIVFIAIVIAVFIAVHTSAFVVALIVAVARRSAAMCC